MKNIVCVIAAVLSALSMLLIIAARTKRGI